MDWFISIAVPLAIADILIAWIEGFIHSIWISPSFAILIASFLCSFRREFIYECDGTLGIGSSLDCYYIIIFMNGKNILIKNHFISAVFLGAACVAPQPEIQGDTHTYGEVSSSIKIYAIESMTYYSSFSSFYSL
jgi:predicted membrane protein